MAKHIVVIQGHPDRLGNHFGQALAQAYRESAIASGHEVAVIEVAKLDFPLLRSKEEFETGIVPDSIQAAQKTIQWAEHLVIFYPLWLGAMPALLKGFLEQVFRPEFVGGTPETGKSSSRPLSGKTAHIVITMGMPAFFYRWFFGAHSLKSLERNILGFCGIKPIKESLIGQVEAEDSAEREKWLTKMRSFGHDGR